MNIIAIANQKGGVAKTTTSIALAAGLKNKGCKVLAIDIDQQGNMSKTFGANNNVDSDTPTLIDVLMKKVDINDVIQKSNICDIIPSNLLLAEADKICTTNDLMVAMKNLRKEYDYVIIDTPPSLGVCTLNAFCAADQVLVVTTPDIYATEGILRLNETIQSIKKVNPTIKINGILITRFEKATNNSKVFHQLTKQIASLCNTNIYKTVIRKSVAVSDSASENEDIFTYDKNSNPAKDYMNFVNEFLQRQGV